MPRNVEIKARIDNLKTVLELIGKVTSHPAQLIEQEDIFFNCPTGRIKLRILSDTEGELIFYQRDDLFGPKTCRYQVVNTDRPRETGGLLGLAFGELVRVKKTRRLFMVGRTRIHVDAVEGLGDFLELEVVLTEEESPQDGEAEALELMQNLDISQQHLIDRAYADLLIEADGK